MCCARVMDCGIARPRPGIPCELASFVRVPFTSRKGRMSLFADGDYSEEVCGAGFADGDAGY